MVFVPPRMTHCCHLLDLAGMFSFKEMLARATEEALCQPRGAHTGCTRYTARRHEAVHVEAGAARAWDVASAQQSVEAHPRTPREGGACQRKSTRRRRDTVPEVSAQHHARGPPRRGTSRRRSRGGRQRLRRMWRTTTKHACSRVRMRTTAVSMAMTQAETEVHGLPCRR